MFLKLAMCAVIGLYGVKGQILSLCPAEQIADMSCCVGNTTHFQSFPISEVPDFYNSPPSRIMQWFEPETMVSHLKAEDVVKELGLIRHCEGGYFREVYRSGSVPMSTKGQTDMTTSTTFQMTPGDDASRYSIQQSETPTKKYESLTFAFNRSDRRPDGDIRRNCLTTIYWMAIKDENLPLAINLSDHVHFYHGGAAFEYITYDPETKVLSRDVLGPDLRNGQQLQVAVRGGVWKCGRLLTPAESKNHQYNNNTLDFCLIGEAVAPGFDYYDFCWVTLEQVENVDPEIQIVLRPFLQRDINKVSDKTATIADALSYYK